MSFIEKILQKKDTKEYFIALGVEEHRIIAAVAEIFQTQINIVGHGESEFREGENEIEAADIAISTAEKGLPENIFIRKVIYGLPPIFLDGEKIKPEYMGRLDKISAELDLDPQGFVEYPQALASYIEKKEDASPTLLLLSIGRNHLILSLLRVGKVEKNIVTARSTSLNSDFEKILQQCESEILPSRLIIYDEVKGVQMEAIKEELLQFSWHKFQSFLHTPKIEILEDSAIFTALVEAAAGSLIKQFAPTVSKIETKPAPSPEDLKKEKAKDGEEESESFGFTTSSTAQIATAKTEEIQNEVVDNIRSKFTNPTLNESPSIPPTIPKISLPLQLPSIPLHLPSFSFNIIPVIFLIFAVITSIILIFAFLYYYPKASVNLVVYPQYSSQQLNIILTSNSNKVNPDKKIILAKTVSEEVNGDKTIQTTGTAKIGENAKGEVAIYNKTTSGKTFPKGTILSNGSLKFTLDKDVSIASASDTGEGLTFGKVNTSIIAAEIGPESNLTAGSIFGIKDFPQSSYYAKNNAAFTGGTSRDVASASKDDQVTLLNTLTKELETAARQKVIQKLTPEDKLIDASVVTDIITQKFSKEVGAEAKEISLSLKLKVSAYTYSESDLANFIKKDIFTAPVGFKIDNSKIQTKISQVKTDKNGDLTATAVLTASFLPEIDISAINAKISGKSYQDASSYISTITNIGGLEITGENNISFFSNTLPWNKEHIKIYIVPR